MLITFAYKTFFCISPKQQELVVTYQIIYLGMMVLNIVSLTRNQVVRLQETI